MRNNGRVRLYRDAIDCVGTRTCNYSFFAEVSVYIVFEYKRLVRSAANEYKCNYNFCMYVHRRHKNFHTLGMREKNEEINNIMHRNTCVAYIY